MTSAMFSMKVGDLLPSIRIALTGEPAFPGATPPIANLQGATGVRFLMIDVATRTIALNQPAAFEADSVIRYDWQEGDTDVAGLYEIEVIVDFGGLPMSYPADRNLLMRIVEGTGV